MAATVKRSILVVAGVGNGSGTGAATARVFAKAGYRVALIARNADNLKKTADDIKATGGDAAPFPIASYDQSAVAAVFAAIKAHWPDSEVRVAVWNAAFWIMKPFLDISEAEAKEALDTNVLGAFAFARAAILTFKDQPLDDGGKRGTLIFTGATASQRGNKTTAAFSASKFGTRALAQSLSKEFGKQNIHVAHVIIDGGILTDRIRAYVKNPEWEADEDKRLSPESIGTAYLYLAGQDRSAWTWELDLRPAHENW